MVAFDKSNQQINIINELKTKNDQDDDKRLARKTINNQSHDQKKSKFEKFYSSYYPLIISVFLFRNENKFELRISIQIGVFVVFYKQFSCHD